MGELLVSTSRMHDIVRVDDRAITVQPGVTVAAMQDRLSERGAWFPPAPTFTGATAGGIVATNAAGAATFKYGSTRGWVEAIRIVLADGCVLDVRRGWPRERAGHLSIDVGDRQIDVPVPDYRMPDVPKRSAGYFAEPGMELIDLFIGSEGTLGILTEITFRVLPHAPARALAFVPCARESQSLSLVEELRSASIRTWRDRNPRGLDVAAIEHLDRRSLEILREDGVDRRHNVGVPASTAVALLIQIELDPAITHEAAFASIAGALGPDAPDTALSVFCRVLDHAGLLADTEIALPGDRRRMEELVAVGEAVPAGVNQRVG